MPSTEPAAAACRPTPEQRYGYTRTEARLAALLAEGHALRDAAETIGVTYGTARVYLKTVFEKTDVHTQARSSLACWATNRRRPASRGMHG